MGNLMIVCFANLHHSCIKVQLRHLGAKEGSAMKNQENEAWITAMK
jgi:hypothetical protein